MFIKTLLYSHYTFENKPFVFQAEAESVSYVKYVGLVTN